MEILLKNKIFCKTLSLLKDKKARANSKIRICKSYFGKISFLNAFARVDHHIKN